MRSSVFRGLVGIGTLPTTQYRGRLGPTMNFDDMSFAIFVVGGEFAIFPLFSWFHKTHRLGCSWCVLQNTSHVYPNDTVDGDWELCVTW